MTFAQLANGSSVVVDANSLVYYFQQLRRFQTAVDDVLHSRIQVLPLEPSLLPLATRPSRRFGLLINDALLVVLMQQHGLTNVASNDADFDRVPGLTRYAPG
jgi:predicted nucleic acid-binding protein